MRAIFHESFCGISVSKGASSVSGGQVRRIARRVLSIHASEQRFARQQTQMLLPSIRNMIHGVIQTGAVDGHIEFDGFSNAFIEKEYACFPARFVLVESEGLRCVFRDRRPEIFLCLIDFIGSQDFQPVIFQVVEICLCPLRLFATRSGAAFAKSVFDFESQRRKRRRYRQVCCSIFAFVRLPSELMCHCAGSIASGKLSFSLSSHHTRRMPSAS